MFIFKCVETLVCLCFSLWVMVGSAEWRVCAECWYIHMGDIARGLYPLQEGLLNMVFYSICTGFFGFFHFMFWKAPFNYENVTKKARVIQAHMQRVTIWPSHLLGNTNVFISWPPRKGKQQPNFRKPRCASSSVPLFHNYFQLFF